MQMLLGMVLTVIAVLFALSCFQVVETGHPGLFKVWALVGQELHQLKVKVPRIFYLNSKEPKPNGDGEHFRKCNKNLPRSHHTHNLYEYTIPEELYKATSKYTPNFFTFEITNKEIYQFLFSVIFWQISQHQLLKEFTKLKFLWISEL